jgi:hypothetical protein
MTFILMSASSFSTLLSPFLHLCNQYAFPPRPTQPCQRMVGYGITTVGWGRDNEDVYGEGLTQIDVTIRGPDECNYKYNQTDRKDMIRIKTQLPRLLISSQYCADNNVNTGIGTCHGDSGGPSFTR